MTQPSQDHFFLLLLPAIDSLQHINIVMAFLNRSYRALSTALPAVSSSSQHRSIVTVARTSLPLASSASPCAARQPSLVRYKSKKSKSSFATEINDPGQHDFEASSDRPVMNTKGKGGKAAKTSSPRGAKSKRGGPEQAEAEDDGNYKYNTRDNDLPGENYDEKALTANMQRAVQRCKETATQMVGMHGRADPGMLDSVKVAYPSDPNATYPLREFASVGTRDGALLVTCYDKDMVKHVERAIHLANLGLTPQTTGSGDEGILKIPIPRPTAETRTQLLKDVNRICENARVSIRAARHTAQKQIKRDTDSKIVGTSEAAKEQKKMDEEAKARQKEVEDFYNGLKKKIESERDT